MRRLLPWILVFPLAWLPTEVNARRARSRPHAAASRPLRTVAPLTRDGLPNIQAHAAVIVDLKTGGEFFARNPDAVRPIASISKLMAGLVVLEKGLKLDDTTTITKDDKQCAARGARSRLLEGMTLSNRDLLHAALISSDNRAVPALGRAVGLSPAQMAAAMTERAHALGLRHTEFKDPTGLDDGNVSTPRETVRMLQAVLKHPLLAEVLRKSHYTAQPVGRRGAIQYTNTDLLTRSSRWDIHGGKTGYTDIARYCLVVSAKLEGREVGMAFLGAEGKLTRFGDFNRAADWLLRRPDLVAKPGPGVMTATSAPATPPATPAAAPAEKGTAGGQ